MPKHNQYVTISLQLTLCWQKSGTPPVAGTLQRMFMFFGGFIGNQPIYLFRYEDVLVVGKFIINRLYSKLNIESL